MKLQAQTSELIFDHLTAQDGLSNSYIRAFLKDDKGFLWIGTNNGLYRYDGYNFRAFKSHPNKPNSLYQNVIELLFQDSRGNIWIAFGNQTDGINCYNPRTEQFTLFLADSSLSGSLLSGEVSCFFEDSRQNLWIGTSNGLSCYNSDHKSFDYYLQQPADKDFSGVNAIIEDNYQRLWVATKGGLVCLDTDKNKSYYYEYQQEDNTSLTKGAVSGLLHDSQGLLWVASAEQGFCVCRPPKDNKKLKYLEFKRYAQFAQTRKRAAVKSMVQDKSGDVWLGTGLGIMRLRLANRENGKLDFYLDSGYLDHYNQQVVTKLMIDYDENIWAISSSSPIGLACYNPQQDTFELYQHNPVDDNSPSSNRYAESYVDSTGILWLGSLKTGIDKVIIRNKGFNTLKHNPFQSNSLISNDVYSICETSDQQLWIGTSGGLSCYDRNAQRWRHFNKGKPEPDSYSLFGRLIGAITQDHQGQIWIGYMGAQVSRYNPQEEEFRHFTFHPMKINSLKAWSFRAIIQDNQKNIWLGSGGQGLVKYMFDADSFAYYLAKPTANAQYAGNFIWCIYEQADEPNILWVGTRLNGLYRFDKRKEEFFNYRYVPNDTNSLSSNDVHSVLLDGQKRLWIGTSNGLNCLDLSTNLVRRFSEDDGLPSDYICGLLLDGSNHLWISTKYGISQLDLDKLTFKNYHQADGLLDEEYNETAVFQNQQGELFFGGTNGLTFFHPDSLKIYSSSPTVVLTNLLLFNQIVNVGDSINGRIILREAFAYTQKLVLTHRENDFSIEFAALDYYHSPVNNHYAYRLEGYDKNWKQTDGYNRRATYTSLPPDVYQFKLKAVNSDGVWSKDTLVLEIVIRPPWWRTLWFKLCLSSFLIICIFLFYKYKTAQIKRYNRELEEQVEERTLQISQQKEEIQAQAEQLRKQTENLQATNLELNNTQSELLAQNEKIKQQRNTLFTNNIRLRRQKDEINRMAQQLHESDQMKLRFFTNISHEFRTPLTLLTAPLERLLQKDKHLPADKIQQWHQLMYRNARRLLRLINQLLDIRQIETDQLKLKTQQADVVSFLKEIVDGFDTLAEQRQIDLIFQSTVETLELWFDPDMLEKIVYNILSNAFKHTPARGSIMVRINNQHEALREQQRYICLEFEDTGKGIPPEQLPYVFDRFYYTESKQQQNNQSSGIGLSLTKDLVERHYGKINLTSRVDKGTLVCVRLPLGADHLKSIEKVIDKKQIQHSGYAQKMLQNDDFETETNERLIQNEQSNIAPKTDKPLLLVVEDHDDLRTFLYAELKNNYEVIEATNGAEGLEKAVEYTPKLIISDVMMPEMNGLQLCKHLKTDERTSHIPVILLTARSSDDQQLEGLETGADDYIPKPFNMSILLARIHNQIEARRKLREQFVRMPHIPLEAIAPSNIDHQFLMRLSKIVEDNLTDSAFDNTRFIRLSGMSKSQLYRKLKNLTDQSVSEFIRYVRLKKAVELFQNGEDNISGVAYDVGFKSPSQFTRSFNASYGQSPSEFIKKLKRP